MPLKFVERVGGGAGAVSFHPGYVRLLDELSEGQAFAIEAVEGVTPVGQIAEHLLTPVSRLLRPQSADFTERKSAVSPAFARVVPAGSTGALLQ